MKLSVFYDHIREAAEQTGRPEQEIFSLCRSFGITGLEIRGQHLKTQKEQILEILSENGMQVSCVYEFFDFGSVPDEEGAREQIDLAAEAGAHRVLVVPGTLPEAEAAALRAVHNSREATFRQLDESAAAASMRNMLAVMTEYAAAKGILVTLEDFDGDLQPFSGMYQLLWFMERTPGLKFTLDMGNFAYIDENVEQAYELLQTYIVHVHCKDRRKDEPEALPELKALRGASGPAASSYGDNSAFGSDPANERNNPSRSADAPYRYRLGLAPAPAGTGYIPVGKLIARLKEWGYDGYLAIEHFDAPDQLLWIRRSAEYLRTFS